MTLSTRSHNPARAWAAALSLLALATVAGCDKGSPMAPVRGKVTYQGKPIPFGTVMFQHESGGQPASGEIKDGAYELNTFSLGAGARAGKNLVRITSFEGQNPAKRKTLGSGEVVLGKSLIPEKYQTFGNGLTADVKPDEEQTFDFNLTK